jgi:hypothetical protein
MLPLLAGVLRGPAGASGAAAAWRASAAARQAALGQRGGVDGCESVGARQRRGLHLAPPFLVDDYVPAAVTTHRLGRMQARPGAAHGQKRPRPVAAAGAHERPLPARQAPPDPPGSAPCARQAKVDQALRELADCRACPRRAGPWGALALSLALGQAVA